MCMVYAQVCAHAHPRACRDEQRTLGSLPYHSLPYSLKKGSLIEPRARLETSNPQRSFVSIATVLGFQRLLHQSCGLWGFYGGLKCGFWGIWTHSWGSKSCNLLKHLLLLRGGSMHSYSLELQVQTGSSAGWGGLGGDCGELALIIAVGNAMLSARAFTFPRGSRVHTRSWYLTENSSCRLNPRYGYHLLSDVA